MVITTTKKNKAAGVVKGDLATDASSSPGLRFREGLPTGEEREGRGKGREKVVRRVVGGGRGVPARAASACSG